MNWRGVDVTVSERSCRRMVLALRIEVFHSRAIIEGLVNIRFVS
jgi:hypothetical protein